MNAPDRCPRHPGDRKPFAPDPGMLARWTAIVAAGKEHPYAHNGQFAGQSYAKRMECLDVVCALAESLRIRFVLEIKPGGLYVVRPDEGQGG